MKYAEEEEEQGQEEREEEQKKEKDGLPKRESNTRMKKSHTVNRKT